MKHTMVIKPAILPDIRHKVEDLLVELGFKVTGSGGLVDMTSCDISFEWEPIPENKD